MPNNLSRVQKGFTLVELMLAMAFFTSILLISSATFVQMLGIYNKGVAVKQMNQAGRTLTDNILRSGNAGASSLPQPTKDNASPQRIHCLQIGSATYLFSYAADEASPVSEAYYLDTIPTKTLVNFVRYNRAGVSCPPSGGMSNAINPADVSPVMGKTLRVYDVDMVTSTNGTVTFKMSIGTFAGVGTPSNVQLVSGNLTCPVDSIGNFCAFSTYDTVLYVPTNSY